MAHTETMQTWLEDLRALADALRSGMEALAGCRLESFSQVHAQQVELCARLQRHATAYEPEEPESGAQEQRALAAHLRETACTVEQLNRQYAAFLRHAGRSLQARVNLERGLAGRIGPSSSYAKAQPRWSCEA